MIVEESADWIRQEVEPKLYRELLDRQFNWRGNNTLEQVYDLAVEQTPAYVHNKKGECVGYVNYNCRICVLKDPDGIAASIIGKHRCHREVLHDIVGYDS